MILPKGKQKGDLINYKNMPYIPLAFHTVFYLFKGNPHGIEWKYLKKTFIGKKGWRGGFWVRVKTSKGRYLVLYATKRLYELELFPPMKYDTFLDSAMYALESMKYYPRAVLIYGELTKTFLDRARVLKPFKIYKSKLDVPTVPRASIFQKLYQITGFDPNTGEVEEKEVDRIILFDGKKVDSIPTTKEGIWKEAHVDFLDIVDEGHKIRLVYVCNLMRKVKYI